jgi:uncharacterized protein YqgC (DUF456 family)
VSYLISAAVIIAMLVSIALIPVGLPGLWIIVVIVLGLVATGSLTWTFGLVATVVAGAAEVGELLVLRRYGKVYGGSRKAFWGAVLGGMIGLFVGLPVPVVGSLITAFLGTFLGAGLVTYIETQSIVRSTRVGWGLVVARTLAVALKVATAAAMVGAVAVTLLLRVST